MRLPVSTLLLATALLAAQGNAAAAVQIQFDDPARFTDVPRDAVERNSVLAALRRHFEQLAQRLPADADLRLQIKDIDLAGQVEPHGRLQREIRVMRDRADAPQMEIAYALTQNGREVAHGEDHLADLDYTFGINRYPPSDPLRYEKSMIDHWFARRFPAH